VAPDVTDPLATWYCTACGRVARPDSATPIDSRDRYRTGRHCDGRRILTSDHGRAREAAAKYQAGLAARRAERSGTVA